jgi:GTPase SAR1 family protein
VGVASLAEIIQRETNPFDPITFKTGNFWTQQPSSIITIESIHQQEIAEIEQIFNLVLEDHLTRTVLLTGDSGCGKSYLLKRLKQKLNSQAFFAYIDPCPSSDCIWRHTLRYLVDSLMYTPEKETEPQLIRWLKNLLESQNRSLIEKLLGEKGLFILNFRSKYPTGIFQAKDFFTVLYQLTQPDLYLLACDWLRGENLDEQDSKTLGVSSVIDSEIAAKGIIENLGIISTANQPIVLCFDQVETYRNSDGSFDFSSVFNINTTIHNDNLKNFLVLISITRDQFITKKADLPQSDLARLEQTVNLKQINLEQVIALWHSRLASLHAQANPQPNSPIAPLEEQQLRQQYPGEKANLRDSLALASKLFLAYKTGNQNIKENLTAAFQLLWQQEYQKTQKNITRIRQFASQELIKMLQQSMQALKVSILDPSYLSGKYASYSFSYQLSEKNKKIAILWNEEPSLKSFVFAMKACERAIALNPDYNLILIRGENLGTPKHKCYQLFSEIFVAPSHRHLIAELDSVYYLKTYQRLANEAIAGDLVLGSQLISLPQLQTLVRDTQVLRECRLLQELGIVVNPLKKSTAQPDILPVKELIFNLVQVNQIIGKQQLIIQVQQQKPKLAEQEITQLIAELDREQKIAIANPNAPVEEQIVAKIK